MMRALELGRDLELPFSSLSFLCFHASAGNKIRSGIKFDQFVIYIYSILIKFDPSLFPADATKKGGMITKYRYLFKCFILNNYPLE